MAKKRLILLILIIIFNLNAQQDNEEKIDSGTTSQEVVSSIVNDSLSQQIDSTSEQLLDSLYSSGEEEMAVVETTTIKKVPLELKHTKKSSKEIYSKDDGSKIGNNKTVGVNSISLKIKNFLKTLIGYVIPLTIGLVLISVVFGLIFILRKKVESSRFLTSTRLSLMDKEVQIACRYMENNYWNNELTLDKLCDELVTGVAFLEALFMKELGMGIEDFLRQVRINRARKSLEKNPQMPVYEVAEKCGYSDTDLFQKDFQSTTSLSFDDFVSTIIK